MFRAQKFPLAIWRDLNSSRMYSEEIFKVFFLKKISFPLPDPPSPETIAGGCWPPVPSHFELVVCHSVLTPQKVSPKDFSTTHQIPGNLSVWVFPEKRFHESKEFLGFLIISCPRSIWQTALLGARFRGFCPVLMIGLIIMKPSPMDRSSSEPLNSWKKKRKPSKKKRNERSWKVALIHAVCHFEPDPQLSLVSSPNSATCHSKH